ncbi:MAG TPA: glycoside hydrolase family 19 protein, partial [Allosphingosinicella sp.]
AGIDATPLRFAHFLAQLGHESGGFRYMEEIASGEAYEGRRDLGNVQPGDGRRFKGRGPIQLTGRANYREFGRRVGIDLEGHPEIAALPSIGMLTACTYWTVKGLNALADRDDLDGITRRINGGTNGLADRAVRLRAMKALLP